jgi:CRISPR-associated protein Cas2
MRRCYLVCYDVREPRRLRRVHRLLKGYGEPWQFSVFFCPIKDIDRVRLERQLREIINLSEDEVLLLSLDADTETARARATVLGLGRPVPSNSVVVI